MKLIIHENLDISETEITINCKTMDERLQKLVRQIEQYTYLFPVRTEDGQCLVPAENVYYVDSVDSKTFLYTENQVYHSPETLVELENKLLDSTFVRISKNCILNTAFLKSVRPLWNNRLEAFLTNEEKLIISRHYIKNVREKIKS